MRAPALADKGQVLPTDARLYHDPVTEFPVYRLTAPSYSSFLPHYYCRAVARRGNYFLYVSDRAGSMQVYRMDLRTGESRQITEAEALEPSAVTLLPDERSFAYLDGRSLRQTSLSSLRGREICRIEEGYEPGKGFCVSGDGVHAVLVETREGKSRLRLISVARGTATTVVEVEGEISEPMPRPRRAGILYRGGGDSLWIVNYDGQQNRRLKLAPGGLGPALWAPDGRTFLYLNYPEDSSKLNNIREFTPDFNEDKLVAETSQFVHFGINADATVLVGASRNKASPHVLLLVRAVRRELTLCEHRASQPASVAPIFSHDSQRVYFQSDKDGKPAIYYMVIDRLVEKTET